jgi:splicing factor 3A subunit 2
MDRDWGAKAGSGGVASSTQAKVDRRERLRQLALQTVDLMKDPYFMKNHLGSYECKLCLTLHNNEGNYLAHTQGKRHQQNLARRAAKDAMNNPVLPQANRSLIKPRKTVKIGRPGYRVTKQMDPETQQRSLLFEIDYPEIEEGLQPRHRFMSAYEQRVETPDRDWQYVLFAAEPYETIAFKIPNQEIDKDPTKFKDGANTVVAIDTVGAGEGELVMFCQGSSARNAQGLKSIPVDAAIIAIVDRVEVLGLNFQVIAVPGHTLGHIAYYSPGLLFCGDTLFSAAQLRECGLMVMGAYGHSRLAEMLLGGVTRRMRRIRDPSPASAGPAPSAHRTSCP